jgi:hypothetical protein
MELFPGIDTAERIAWGLLSFILLIVYLRWAGPPREDQKKDEPPADKSSSKR